MPPDLPARLQHILDAGEMILRVTAGKSFYDYASDPVLRLAVERLFEIVGEALKEAGKLESSLQARVTAFRQIVDFRNVLVHDYSAIYNEGVWQRIAHDLPLLLTEVRALLAEP